MNKCHFDKKEIFHRCNDDERDCIGCEFEHIIAKSIVTICQSCGKEIASRYAKHFCNKKCQLEWQTNRMSYDPDLDGGLFWGEPIFTEDGYKLVQRMLGFRQ
ncbi:hypothetical protein ES704_01987 [subsurface metagenome]|jgi:hypothetical protein